MPTPVAVAEGAGRYDGGSLWRCRFGCSTCAMGLGRTVWIGGTWVSMEVHHLLGGGLEDGGLGAGICEEVGHVRIIRLINGAV